MKKIIISLLITSSFSFFIAGGAIAQAVNEDSLILRYCSTHKLTPVKSPSGLYYVIKNPGKGAPVEDGKTVSINYTGSLANGKIFDSNRKKKFHHKTPFQYTVGKGMVIKGFEEGMKLLHSGGSAIIVIPPSLGYGDRNLGVIPPNSVLVFEVSILSVN